MGTESESAEVSSWRTMLVRLQWRTWARDLSTPEKVHQSSRSLSWVLRPSWNTVTRLSRSRRTSRESSLLMPTLMVPSLPELADPPTLSKFDIYLRYQIKSTLTSIEKKKNLIHPLRPKKKKKKKKKKKPPPKNQKKKKKKKKKKK